MQDSILEIPKKSHFLKALFLGFFFFVFLACFLHMHEVKREMGELNSIASHYLFAETDFAFFDDEATRKLKQRVAEDIGAVYKIDENEVRKRLLDLESEQDVSEEMKKEAVIVERLLYNTRFADEHTLEKLRHLQRMHQGSFSPYAFHSLVVAKDFWKELEEKASHRGSHYLEVVSFFKSHLENFKGLIQKDFSLERSLRHLAQDAVLPQYTKVSQGEPLINPGDKVTKRHLAMEKAMQKAKKRVQFLWEPLPLLGSAILSLVFTSLMVLYLRIQHHDILKSLQKTCLAGVIVITTLLIAKASETFFLHQGDSLYFYFRYPILVPFASLLTSVLIGWEVSLFLSALLTVMIGRSLAVDFAPFLILNMVASFIAIFFARNLHRRREIFGVSAKAWACSLFVLFAFHFIDDSLWSAQLGRDILGSFIFFFTISLIVIGLLPLFESVFQVTTDMTLMEHMDPNNTLLRRLSLEAPGTYQHSLVVGNLSEAAARAIGANGLFCRVSSLYHDVGKLFNPHYFTENQLGGFNIHQLLTPQESAQVIISHVREGEALLRKYHLPQSFIDIAREHHGTSLVYYFYCKHLEQNEEESQKTDMCSFRYFGPKPKTKESAIIMMADTVEAASRCLEEYSEKNLVELVEKLVQEKSRDGQFDDSQLTFEELGIVKKTMVKTLMVSGHLRIKYPSKH